MRIDRMFFEKFEGAVKQNDFITKAVPAMKNFFKAYITDGHVRHIIDGKQFTDLATNPVFNTGDYKTVPKKYRDLIPEYVKDYVSLNQFAA